MRLMRKSTAAFGVIVNVKSLFGSTGSLKTLSSSPISWSRRLGVMRTGPSVSVPGGGVSGWASAWQGAETARATAAAARPRRRKSRAFMTRWAPPRAA